MNPGNRQPDGSMAYRSQVVNYTRTQIQASAGSPSDPSFGGGPSPNPFPGAAGPQGRLSGKPGAPPPSPGMNKDGLKDGGMASKVEDSPRNNMNLPSSAGMTPTASGTSSSTPAPGPPGPGNPLAGLNMNPPPSLQSSQNPTPNSQSVPPPPPPPSTMDSLGVGNQQMGGMNGGGLGADMPLFGDFMSDMAGLESFDPNIFRDSVGGVGGDLNFERDFGQWFNPNDQALEDSLDSMK
ncbi:hypothetical protein GYMLUDRAFT_771446 [Collybiopsis luxurians FD-317 M1]|uniref:Uncharacterized protein n=1 Tax=Collybiopsis luxurians FD-317 M1 TaxID=944289 RepID=A0A0D0B1Q2_9AGAR|nr:hypothetical protein GYMLUDRAFT_771446 [Collybiopsis luxurians FD-317 M1]